MTLSQYLAPSRPVNGSTAIHSAVTKHGKLITLVAGKWQGLLLTTTKCLSQESQRYTMVRNGKPETGVTTTPWYAMVILKPE